MNDSDTWIIITLITLNQNGYILDSHKILYSFD